MRYVMNEKLEPISDGEEAPENSRQVILLTLEQLKQLEEALPHRKMFLREAENPQYCKAEQYGECIFGTMVLPSKKNLLGEKHSFGFYLKRDKLYFVDDGTTVKTHLERINNLPFEEDATLGSLMAVFLDTLIHDDVLLLQKQEKQLSETEELLLMDIPKDYYRTIMKHRKEIMALHTYYEQLIDMGDVLLADTGHMFTQEECAAFEQFSNRCSRLHDHVERLREYVSQIREMYQSQLTISQNRSMNLLTVITTLFFPLSIMVGWYGMNFKFMPELNWKYGYFFMILVSVMILAFEIRFFKKKKIM